LYFAIFFYLLALALASASCHFFTHHYVCFVLTLAQSIKSVPSAQKTAEGAQEDEEEVE